MYGGHNEGIWRDKAKEVGLRLGGRDRWVGGMVGWKWKQMHLNNLKKEKKEDKLRTILDNMKHNNIHIMGTPEGEEREQRIENLFEEIMTKKLH